MKAQQQQPATLTITFPWPASPLWPNRSNGHHWSVRGLCAMSARRDARLLTLQALRKAVLLLPKGAQVTYTFHPPTRRRFDLEGAYSAMKPAQDGLADALGVDDYCFAPVVLLRGEPRKGGQVVVTINAVKVVNS